MTEDESQLNSTSFLGLRDVQNMSTQSVHVNVREMEKAMAQYRDENFDLKLRLAEEAKRNQKQASLLSHLTDLERENEELKAKINAALVEKEAHVRALADAQNAVEVIRKRSEHAIRNLTEAKQELETQNEKLQTELEQLENQLALSKQERDTWEERASAASSIAQQATQAVQASTYELEDAAFRRAKEMEAERDQLYLEVQSLKAENEKADKLLIRYREQSERDLAALQTARERLKRMTAWHDSRIADVRQEEQERYQEKLLQLESQVRSRSPDRTMQDRLIERNALLIMCLEHLDAILTPTVSNFKQSSHININSDSEQKPTSSQLCEETVFRLFERELLSRLRTLMGIYENFKQQCKRMERTQEDKLRLIQEKFHVHLGAVQKLQQQLSSLQTERVRWNSSQEVRIQQLDQAEQRAQAEIRRLREALSKETQRTAELALEVVNLEECVHQKDGLLSSHMTRLHSFVKKAASLVRLLVSVDRRQTMEDIAEALMDLLRQLNKSRTSVGKVEMNVSEQEPNRQQDMSSSSSESEAVTMEIAKENAQLAQEVRKLKQQLNKREFLIKKALSRLEQINEQTDLQDATLLNDFYQES